MPAPALNISLSVKRELRTLGASLREARLLRRLPMELVAERAGTTRSTLYRMERGDPNVRIGAYLLTLQALGLLKGFGTIEDALAETIIGLYKTKVIQVRGPWRRLAEVEYATLEWVDWFNRHRLLAPIGHRPPAEYEQMYYDDINRSCKAA